ncbi:unnamed protein product [Cylindrotheca closterium]|uniref:DUF4954 domain-containing protein n=1 Tax=Cylindrotheca closterium TaxID=2856 RepID=A0AAD2FAJ7_9STRA|nr:unnamed protein product [Cylindrotheca closterium]
MSLELSDDFIRVFTARDAQLRDISRLLDLVGAQFNDVTDRHVIRSLKSFEVQTLESCRCTCTDWSTLRVLIKRSEQSSDLSPILKGLVSDTRFDGAVILIVDDDDKTSKSGLSKKGAAKQNLDKLPAGIHSNLMVSDSIIHLKSARIYRNTVISKTFVGPDCTIVNCGMISAPNDYEIGHIKLSVGPESGGGRPLHLTLEHTMIDVCRQLRSKPPTSSTTSAIQNINMNVLTKSNVLRDTPTIENIYLHENASIEAATSVSKVTMLPDSIIGSSCTVSNALLQWNAGVSDNSSITDVLLMERAHCGPSGIVVESVMGPDVHTSAGEVHASVIGPNTNAHHQSLVIGVLWPLGRGNVGYGANVGSNHTGRLPDQETASGEGTFWGLSCVIKFPVDLTFAPYSIVAAGTTLSPQRVCMPFSLILEQQSGGNEIIPGWVLQSSPYTLARSEKKFATRRKAKRHDFYTGWKIQRQEIIDMCRWARNVLQQSSGENNKVPGVGANQLTGRARSVGVKAYTECIQRYALHGLLTWISQGMEQGGQNPKTMLESEFLAKGIPTPQSPIDPLANVDWPPMPWDMKAVDEWNFQKAVLVEEFGAPPASDTIVWITEVLERLVYLEGDFARRIHKSKARDDVRGAKTIPGYANAHIAADSDPVIMEARKNADDVKIQVASILGHKSTVLRKQRSRL